MQRNYEAQRAALADTLQGDQAWSAPVSDAAHAQGRSACMLMPLEAATGTCPCLVHGAPLHM